MTNLRKKLITALMIGLPTVILFQNCASNHDGAVVDGSSISGGVVTNTACIAAPQTDQDAAAASATALLQNKCASCHSATGSASTSNIPDIMNFSQLENGHNGNAPEVVMGSPQDSKLYVTAMDASGVHSLNLSSSQLATIRDWILGPNLNCDVLATGAGNPGGAPPATGAAVTFAQVNAQIIQQSCVGCHGAGGTAPALTDYNSVKAVAGTCLSDIQSGKMPLNGSKLSSTLQTLFATWVASGTPQ